MSIISTALSLGKSALGFLTPVGGALKLVPWAIAGACALGLYVEHERLIAADARVATAREQTAQAVQQCQTEASRQAAAANAATVQQQDKADAAASQAEVQLFATRAAAQSAADQAQFAVGQQLGTITAQSAQPGQDGPIPPVLANLFQ